MEGVVQLLMMVGPRLIMMGGLDPDSMNIHRLE